MARVKNVPPLRTKGYAWGQLRVRRGVSMRELAERSGVPKSVLSFVESGRVNPTAEEFNRVMAALGVDSDEHTREVQAPTEGAQSAAKPSATTAGQESATRTAELDQRPGAIGTSQPVTGTRQHSLSDPDIQPSPAP